MTDVLVQFDEPQRSTDGRRFVARVVARRTPSWLWEGTLELVPLDGGDPIRTAVRTTQLTRNDVRYWAAHLTTPSVASALQRALAGGARGGDTGTAAVERSDGGAAARIEWAPALLDPIALYLQDGAAALRRALRALDAPALDAVIATHAIPEIETVDLARTFEDALAERIVAGVQQRVAARSSSAAPSPR